MYCYYSTCISHLATGWPPRATPVRPGRVLAAAEWYGPDEESGRFRAHPEIRVRKHGEGGDGWRGMEENGDGGGGMGEAVEPGNRRSDPRYAGGLEPGDADEREDVEDDQDRNPGDEGDADGFHPVAGISGVDHGEVRHEHQ